MTTTHPLLRQITESLKRTNELRGELARVCRPLECPGIILGGLSESSSPPSSPSARGPGRRLDARQP
jgi:hypothetical protein